MSLSSRALMHPRAARREDGFTLVELLVVLAILGMIVALVTPQVLKYLGRAKFQTAHIEIQTLGNALDLFRLDMQRYPTQEEGLEALVEAPPGDPQWNGPYLKQNKLPLDPWGHPYRYRFPGQHGDYDLYSLGPDGEGGDAKQQVTSW